MHREPLRIGQILDRALHLIVPVYKELLIPYIILAFVNTIWAWPFEHLLPLPLTIILKVVSFVHLITMTLYIGFKGIYVAAAYWNEDPSLKDGEITVWLVLRAMGMGIRITFIAMLGFLLFIIPGFIYLAYRMLAGYALILEQLSISDAIRKSKFLMSQGKWYSLQGPLARITGLTIILFIMGFFGALAAGIGGFTLALGKIGGVSTLIPSLVAIFIGTLLSQAVQAYSIISHVGFYYDLRARYEGMDLIGQLSKLDAPTSTQRSTPEGSSEL